VDLIDWSYRGHSVEDTLDKLSIRSVDAVGETLQRLIERLDDEPPKLGLMRVGLLRDVAGRYPGDDGGGEPGRERHGGDQRDAADGRGDCRLGD
jgi:hypothetical protein